MDEPIWISRAILEAMHSDQIRAHGGQPGLRDLGLLESALARPRNTWTQPDVDLAALAAEYAFGLIKNHAFLDGNKRIGFVAANVFSILNGQEIDVAETEVVETVLRVAEGTLDRDGLADWLRRSLKDYTE